MEDIRTKDIIRIYMEKGPVFFKRKKLDLNPIWLIVGAVAIFVCVELFFSVSGLLDYIF